MLEADADVIDDFTTICSLVKSTLQWKEGALHQWRVVVYLQERHLFTKLILAGILRSILRVLAGILRRIE